jgi:hypothetical protein
MSLTASALPTTAASLDWHDIKLGLQRSFINCTSHLPCLGSADAQESSSVSDRDDRFEARFLSSVSLLLYEAYPEDFLLQSG